MTILLRRIAAERAALHAVLQPRTPLPDSGLVAHRTLSASGWSGAHDDDKGVPGYQGRLNDSCVTTAEALRPAGYFTAMTGKWNVGQNYGVTPWGRGFDRSLNAAAGGFYFPEAAKAKLFLNGLVPLSKCVIVSSSAATSAGLATWKATSGWGDWHPQPVEPPMGVAAFARMPALRLQIRQLSGTSRDCRASQAVLPADFLHESSQRF